MSILARIKTGLKAAFPEFPIWGGGVGRQGSFGVGWMLPGSKRDYAKLAGRVYDNGVVLSAINWMARNFPDAPMVVERKAEGEEGTAWKPVPHRLTEIVESPNPWYDGSVLWQGTLLSLTVTGNAYWAKVRSQSGQLVGFLYIPHFQMRPMSDKDNPGGTRLVTYYEFTPLGGGATKDIPIEDVVHFRWGIDPTNQMQGLSPLAASLREIVTDNEAATYSVAILSQMGIPGAVISPSKDMDPPTPEQKTLLKKAWQETFTGDGRGTACMLPIPVDVTNLGFNPEQLALKSLRDVPVSRICSALGFDPMVLGLPSESKTYSNYREAIEAAYEGTLIPIKRIIGSALTRQVLRTDYQEAGDRVGWDYSQVRALQDDQDKLFKRWGDIYKAGVVKRSMALAALKLPADASDDVYYTDVSASPADKAKSLAKAAGARASKRREVYEALGLDDDTENDEDDA